MRLCLILMGITLLAAGSLGSAQWKKAKDKNAPAAGSKKPTETKTAGKVPQSGDGPEPPKPATSEKKAAKSNFRSSKRSKPKCKHECLGNQRCRHIRQGLLYSFFLYSRVVALRATKLWIPVFRISRTRNPENRIFNMSTLTSCPRALK